MKKLAVTIALVGAASMIAAPAVAIPDTTTITQLTGLSTQGSAHLTATAWESFVPGFTVSWNGGTETFGEEHSEQPGSPTIENYQYRIAGDAGLADVQPGVGDELTPEEQDAWYTEIGYDPINDPYRFDWSIAMCRDGQNPLSTELKPVLNSVRQWSVETTPGFPTVDDADFWPLQYQVDLASPETVWPNLVGSYNRGFQTQVGPNSNEQAHYYNAVSLATYADFSCPQGTLNATFPELVTLVDQNGEPLGSRTIALDNVYVDLTDGNGPVKIDLTGYYALVTGNAISLNAATWGIAEITAAPPASPTTLASTGANVAPLIGIGAIVIIAGVGLVLWTRRRRNDS